MTSQVREKLKSMEAQYEDQLRMVGDPAVQSDQAAYRRLSKALVEVQPVGRLATIGVHLLFGEVIDCLNHSTGGDQKFLVGSAVAKRNLAERIEL